MNLLGSGPVRRAFAWRFITQQTSAARQQSTGLRHASPGPRSRVPVSERPGIMREVRRVRISWVIIFWVEGFQWVSRHLCVHNHLNGSSFRTALPIRNPCRWPTPQTVRSRMTPLPQGLRAEFAQKLVHNRQRHGFRICASLVRNDEILGVLADSHRRLQPLKRRRFKRAFTAIRRPGQDQL
jgi:hypothetical protein